MTMLVAAPSTQITFRKLSKANSSLLTGDKPYLTWAFNRALIIRNWIIGSEIIKYERANQRAKKKAQLKLSNLKRLIDARGLPSSFVDTVRSLYLNYPQIGELLCPKVTPSKDNSHSSSAETIIDNLSFSHLVELLKIGDPLIRQFYERQCIRNLWSANELRRQISTNLHQQVYGKSNSSVEKAMDSLFEIRENKSPVFPMDDPYLEELMDLTYRTSEYFSESELTKRLLMRLEHFLLDLDMRFGYMATQKELKIDNQPYIADLVFYNITLRCYMIIKVLDEELRPEHTEELQTILSYYQQTDLPEGDIPPMGIIICTPKEFRHVEYLTCGSNLPFHLSAYEQNYPSEKQLLTFLGNVID